METGITNACFAEFPRATQHPGAAGCLYPPIYRWWVRLIDPELGTELCGCNLPRRGAETAIR